MINRCAKVLVILVAVLHGCVSAPAPRYYRVPLDFSITNGTSYRPSRGSLRVARFRAVPPLRQDSIVTYQEESPLIEFSPSALWESSPTDIVNVKLAEAFRVEHMFTRVQNRPGRPMADYVIKGKIFRFNRLETSDGLYGEVGLEVELVEQETREILWSAVIKVREKAGSDDPQAVALAVSKALKQCILQITQQVQEATTSHRVMR